MKRSNDVIRNILLLVEEECQSIVDGKQQHLTFKSSDSETKWLTLPGTDRDLAIYHWKLLIDEDLVNGTIHPAFYGEMTLVFSGLTWTGHDLLNTIRQGPVWNEMKELANKSGIDIQSATLSILSKLASMAIEVVFKVTPNV